ncbi:hypothetical protein ACN4EG_12790 [Alkalinema pantanalense CENA528]|uniref:hypothetical protein n=1 Tax=Alkalinema pantanalense TaxID=1620705 RepID=UPI003D6F25BB
MNMLATQAPMAASSAAESGSNFRAVLSSQALLNQLRAHYATGCLLSDLVQTHSDQFIVKAIVEVEGRALASALASASTVEAAEDRARIRVLAVLGISATAPYVTSMAIPVADAAMGRPEMVTELSGVASITEGLPALNATSFDPVTGSAAVVSAVDSTVTSTVTSTATAAPKRKGKTDKAKVEKVSQEDPIAAVAEVERLPELAGTVPEPSIAPEVESHTPMDLPREAFEPVEYEYIPEEEPDFGGAVAPAEPPMDLSDAIAQIGTEIDRIGWTKKQGSAYLQETYSKRTRAELTEAELFAFLKYLKSLPSKMQPNLSQIPF